MGCPHYRGRGYSSTAGVKEGSCPRPHVTASAGVQECRAPNETLHGVRRFDEPCEVVCGGRVGSEIWC